MHPYTEEILKHTGPFGHVGVPFEVKIVEAVLWVVVNHGLAKERGEAGEQLMNVIPDLRSHDFEVSYEATVTVMKLLYGLSEVIPLEYFEPARRGEEDNALYRLFFQTKPAPTSVVVNDWLCDDLCDMPGSLITYSEDEDRFHLVRPNSQGGLSIQRQFLGSYYGATSIWSQFQRIQEVVNLAERLYREGKHPATRGARMEAFKGW
jgi:hypothetical protein